MLVPTPVLHIRDTSTAGSDSTSTSYPTDSLGCLICPSNTECPASLKCGKNQECQLQTQTCNSCPVFFCADQDSGSGSGRSSTPVGGIVGGVVGGVVVILLIAGFLYYRYVYRKREVPDDEVVLDRISHLIEDEDGDKDDTIVADEVEKVERRGGSLTATKRNRRLSSYESFTKPKARYSGKPSTSAQRRERQKQIVQQANANNKVYMDDDPGKRNSIATTISTTNASNILPIAYIPGVTVRPTKNNTRSIYSYDSDSIFSDMNDLNTIENASIVGDVQRANQAALGEVSNNNNNDNNNNNTTTAIKAQPRLVNVDRIEEEDDEDMSEEEFQPEESDDSDVDSDIGEITRATSTRRKLAPDGGSFILDVEMDKRSEEHSPFEDP